MRITAGLVVLAFASISYGAQVISTDTVVQDGDWYDAIEVRDGVQGPTTVSINGGHVEDLLALDSSRIEVAGGEVPYLNMRGHSSGSIIGGTMYLWAGENATVDMTGGHVFLVFDLQDNASVHVGGGFIESGVVGLGGNAKLDATGGRWESLFYSTQNSTITLSNIQTVDGIALWATDTSRVNLLATNTQYDPANLLLTGDWLNGQPFSIRLYDAETFGHVTIVPEPSALLLVFAGVLARAARPRRAA